MTHFDDAPGLSSQKDPATNGFVFNHTMFRIRDPEAALDFYTRILGMTLVKRLDFPDMEFSLYFLSSDDAPDAWSDDPERRLVQTFSRPALLELTHNWGDENKDDISFHNGNSAPKGFGHIGFAVPDLDAACTRLHDLGVSFIKRPQDGSMRGIAFIQDPDGYWIELFTPPRLPDALRQHLST